MSWLRFCVLSAVLCSFAVVGGKIEKPGEPDVIPVHLKDATETTSTSTLAPETSPAASTEPDPKPDPAHNTTSTTTTTTTTTPAPDTTTTTTTTTTPAPPTPPPAPTPAPAPKPLPPVEQGKWVLNQNNVTCIVAQFAAQLTVTYTKDVNNSNVLVNVTLNVPKNATVDKNQSSCGNDTQWLTLTWPSTNTSNNMTLVFYRNDTTKNYALKSFNVSLAHENFPNAKEFNGSLELYYGTAWLTPLATSYRCYAPTKFNMTEDHGSAMLTLSQLQEEAFRTSSGDSFSAARECGGGDVPDAVPIAVGCALGGLVVVVLIAYLVGRRRSAARGYLSM